MKSPEFGENLDINLDLKSLRRANQGLHSAFTLGVYSKLAESKS